MRFDVTILGTSSATTAFGRMQTSQVVNHNERLYLIDCGEGTQLQLQKYKVKKSKINHIFISHLHGDHFFGLIGLISTMHLNGRTRPLYLFGPKGLNEIITVQLKHSLSFLRFEIIFHETDPTRQYVLFENNELEVLTIPLNHRIPCSGFLFREKPKKRKLDGASLPKNLELHQYDLLREGKDVEVDGKVYKNDELTIPPKYNRSYAFCSDTQPFEEFFDYVKSVDVMYHEATFTHDQVERARATHHTTAHEAGQIAARIGIKKLIIGHFSARYKELSPILAESKKEFNNSYLAQEGLTFEI